MLSLIYMNQLLVQIFTSLVFNHKFHSEHLNMKYAFSFKDMVFNFGQTSAFKDGYFEYIDTLNPNGVRRLNFIIEQKPEGNEVNVKTFQPRSEPADKMKVAQEALQLLNAFINTGIVSNAIVTGFRIHFNASKNQSASRFAVYTFPNGNKQYMYANEQVTYFLLDQPVKKHHHHKPKNKPPVPANGDLPENIGNTGDPIYVDLNEEPKPATEEQLVVLTERFNS